MNDVSGFFYLDKPEDCTSFDLIRSLRKITSQKKFGHTGTLDPFASGLIILCLNKATKLSSLIINSDKEYLVQMELGTKTDTGDRDGNILLVKEPPILSEEQVFKAASKIKELKTQIPPQYSAKKIQGKAAYKYAREGKEVFLKEKNISIHDFNIISVSGNSIVYRAKVSKGTYVRTLSETFAEYLGTIAYTTNLRRLSVGNITINKAVKLEAVTPDNWQDYLVPISQYNWDIPHLNLEESEARAFLNGSSITLNEKQLEELVEILQLDGDFNLNTEMHKLNANKIVAYLKSNKTSGENECLGIASIKNGVLYPKRVLVNETNR